MASGVLVSLADSALDMGLRRMLDQSAQGSAAFEIVARALIVGLLVVFAAAMLRRAGNSRMFARWV